MADGGAGEVAHYERASPALLIQEEPLAPPLPFDPSEERRAWEQLKNHLEARLSALKGWRYSWLTHWALIGQYLNPRRSLWLSAGGYDQPSPNSMVRGSAINQAILDPTATYASDKCAAGLLEGLMSPSRPWFKLGAGIKNYTPDRAGLLWYEAVQDLFETVMSESNFYTVAAQVMEDVSDFGTAPVLIYEDDEEVINCYIPMVGEYFIAVGSSLRPESFYRMYSSTVSQIVEQFGLENCPQDVRSLWEQKGGNLETERLVAHAVEPNYEIQKPGDPKAVGKIKGDFDYRENYWVWGSSSDFPLSERGFKEQPFIVARGWVSGNEAYGRSFGMNALGDIMQLQKMTLRKAQFLDKLVNPPVNVPVELKNYPTSLLPGHANYTNDTSKGVRPVMEMNAQGLPGITADIKEIQERIKAGFYNDIFLMLAQLSKDMTAYEVAQRMQEKLQVLGPLVERFLSEFASPAIKRIFAILARKKLLPPMPPSLRGIPIKIEFISILAIAQRAAATAGIERLLAIQGKMAALNPAVLDLIDDDEVLREYGDQLGVTHKIFNSPEVVAQIRATRAKQQQMAQQQAMLNQAATETGPALAGAAQTLSNTDTGGGLSALSAMLGSGSGMAGVPQQAGVGR